MYWVRRFITLVWRVGGVDDLSIHIEILLGAPRGFFLFRWWVEILICGEIWNVLLPKVLGQKVYHFWFRD